MPIYSSIATKSSTWLATLPANIGRCRVLWNSDIHHGQQQYSVERLTACAASFVGGSGRGDQEKDQNHPQLAHETAYGGSD